MHCSSLLAMACLTLTMTAQAAEPKGFLDDVRRHSLATSTVPANGDQNPYAIVVAPVSAGKIQAGDVLIDNFNDRNNLQGLGTTIVTWRPATKQLSLFAAIPRNLPQCPGGVGLTTAMTMLKSGWVIVGSLPSQDGTTKTKGQGCLIVLDAQGNVAGTIAGPNINGPWGNMAVIDNGATATLFVSNTGFDVGPPDDEPPVVNKATVLRLELSMAGGKPPVVTRQTVIGSGFGEQADKDVFIIGPTGLALGQRRRALRLRRAGQPHRGHPRRRDAHRQRRHRPRRDQGRAAEAPAGDDNGAERPPAGDQRAERPGGGDRSGDRHARSPHAGWTPTRRNRRPAAAICSGSPSHRPATASIMWRTR